MIIEVSGPSGVGKTTLIAHLAAEFSNRGYNTGAIHSISLNKSGFIPKRFTEIEKFNLTMDFKIAPWAMFGAITYFKFTYFALCMILNMPSSFCEKIAVTRSLWRKLGLRIYLGRKKFKNVMVFVDEGLFHSAHNLLISPKISPSKPDVAKFSSTCPRPDCLIILNGDSKTITENLRRRSVYSPRVRNTQESASFVSHAIELYEILASNLEGAKGVFEIRLDQVSTDEVVELCFQACLNA